MKLKKYNFGFFSSNEWILKENTVKKSRFHALLDFKENFSYLNELVGLLLAQMFLLKVAQKVKKCIHWNNLTMRSIDASGIFEY